MYDCETWIMTKDMSAKLTAFATSYYRVILNTIGLEKVSKVRIYDLTDSHTIFMLWTFMSRQLKFFGHTSRFEKDKPADIYSLQMMIIMIWGMPGKSDGGQNANGVGQGICLLSLFSRTKRTMPLISWVRQGNNSMQISLVRIVKRKEISSMLLKNCWSRKMNFCSDSSKIGCNWLMKWGTC